jgi:guanylate kinase
MSDGPQQAGGNGVPVGRLVVISGPSGSGKTTICKRLALVPGIQLSVSATTRRRRSGEVEGVDYHFLSRDDFEAKVRDGEFLEHARYNDHLYGTLAAPVAALRRQGVHVLLEIEVQGTELLRRQRVEGSFFFIRPPNMSILQERLMRRATESQDEVERRLQLAIGEMEKQDLYDHVIINDTVERAVAEILGLLNLETARS